MRNPFEFGSVVGATAFCNRKRELADLTHAMESSQKLFLYSERRVGKTSLVQFALSKLPKKHYATVYVDLWPTDGEASFIMATAKAITESLGTNAGQMLDAAKRLFGRLVASVSVDDQGHPRVNFSLGSGLPTAPTLEEVLQAPARIAAEGTRRVVIVFDEFQRIMEYDDDRVERQLRSLIQKQQNVCYLFLGSRKHVIQKMFLDRSRPLYRAAAHYPLGPIEPAAWVPFISTRFRAARKQVEEATIREICKQTEGHPFYTQHLCSLLWERCEPGGKVGPAELEQGLRLLLDRESYAYSTLWDSLALNQRRLLQGLALEQNGVRVFSADFVSRYGLGSPSSAQRAAQSLLNKDLIDRDQGTFLITDRFFRLWVARVQAA